MIQNCDIIRDLLPLYVDDVCSGASRETVEEHIADCPACSDLLRRMKTSELAVVERGLTSEAKTVVSRQTRTLRRKSFTVGIVLSAILFTPVVVCLIVNLAVSGTLSWFFLVLFGLLTAASLIVTPLLAPEHKALLTLAAFTASLMLLLAVCCIYTGGRWFFVAASSTLFGLSLVFLPFVVRSAPIRPLLGSRKALCVMIADTALLALIFVSVGILTGAGMSYARLTAGIAGPLVASVWLLFAVMRYLPANRMLKAGVCCILVGALDFFLPTLIGALVGSAIPLPAFCPAYWNAFTISGNVSWLFLLVCCVLGAIFALVGMIQKRKDK